MHFERLIRAFMIWSDVICLIAVLFLVLGGCFLFAGFFSLNTVVNERSEEDGRLLVEKMTSGSRQDYNSARMEGMRRFPEMWAKQRFTRGLVYCGMTFLAFAGFLIYLAHLITA